MSRPFFSPLLRPSLKPGVLFCLEAVLIATLVLPASAATRRENELAQTYNFDIHQRERVIQRENATLAQEIAGLQDHEALQYLLDELKKEPPAVCKALLLDAAARLYEAIGDEREALAYSQKAHEADPTASEIKSHALRLDSRVNPVPSTVQKIRVFNQNHGLSLSAGLGLEYASNVVLEPVNPANATNKEDTAATQELSLSKAWKWQLRPFAQESGYNFSSYAYFEHSVLNLIVQSLDHRLQYSGMLRGHRLSGQIKLGFNHIFNDAAALLWSGETGADAFWDLENRRLQLDTHVTYRRSTYFTKANQGQEGDNYSISFGVLRHLDANKAHSLRLAIEEIYENTDSRTSRYSEPGVKVTYKNTTPRFGFDSIAPYAGYKWRWYDMAALGGPRRRDQQWSAGMKLERRIAGHHIFAVKGAFTENDSNLAASHYRNTQFSLNYTLDL